MRDWPVVIIAKWGAFLHPSERRGVSPPVVTKTGGLPDFVKKRRPPRRVWLMIPAGLVDHVVGDLVPLVQKGDILIDGGNSYYIDDIRRANDLAGKGMHYLDVGTSGGVWGLERGYC